MVIPSKVNKENFRLLDLSSDEESEDLQLEIIPSRKKKITRRERRGPAVVRPEPSFGAEVRCAAGWAVRGALLLWLLTLTWLCAALYDQLTLMRIDVSKVSTSSDSVGDALQLCHTAAKELQANASSLNTRLYKLEQEHLDLSKKVEQALGELTTLSSELAAAPGLREMPKRLSDLQRTVAELGSQINGFDGSIAATRKQAVTAAAGVEDVKTLLHQLEGRTNETIANVTASMRIDDDIRNQLTALNSTIEGKMAKLGARVEEISKPVSTAPPPTTITTTTTTPPTTSSTTSTTLPPGPPVKPSVLH